MGKKNIYADLLKTLPKAVQTEADLQVSFVKDLERVIALQAPNREPSRTIKPSSIGGCLREQVYALLGAKRDSKMDTAQGIGITDIGTFRHDKLQTAIIQNKDTDVLKWLSVEDVVQEARKKGINTIVRERKGNEIKCYNETYNISFMCDGIIEYRGKTYILEIKTEEVNKHNARFTAEPKHQNQATLYSMCLGVDDVMFLYEDRNLCHKKAFIFHVTPDIKYQMSQRVNSILAYAKAGELPPKERKCMYCKYSTICKLAGDTVAKSLEELNSIIADKENAHASE